MVSVIHLAVVPPQAWDMLIPLIDPLSHVVPTVAVSHHVLLHQSTQNPNPEKLVMNDVS